MLTQERDFDRIERDIVVLAGELATLTERWLRLVAEFDGAGGARRWGFRGTAEWLAWRCGMDARTARDHVRVARRLAEWPELRDAFAAGALSYSKVRALARVAPGDDAAVLIERARACTAGQLEREVRARRSAPSADVGVANAVHASRFLTWEWEEDGSLRLHGRLSPEEGAALIEVLDTAAEALHPAVVGDDGDAGPGEGTGSRPPLGARRADALTEIALTGAPRAHVVLHADAESLACTAGPGAPRAGVVCALEDGPAVPSDTARRLACDGEIDDGLGRRRRVVSPSLRRSLERRDGGCCFPGCDRRHGLHAHHIEHWAHGGRTDRDNLVMLCRFHHRMVHEGGFEIVPAPEGPAFLRPDGLAVPGVPGPEPPVVEAVAA